MKRVSVITSSCTTSLYLSYVFILSARSRFITGEEELSGLPQDIQQIFTLMTEEQFRVDVSSTEIRTRREKNE
jgi:hypothetical protein